MAELPLPALAAWRHRDVRDGFEVLFTSRDTGVVRLEGSTTAVEDGQGWWLGHVLEIDADTRVTRSAILTCRSTNGSYERELRMDAPGRWHVDGVPAPELDGCLDVDLEGSVVTNALPVHRLQLGVGEAAEAPAVFVRVTDLAVERLEQRYERLRDEDGLARYHYTARRFDYEGVLTYDASGLVLTYPGLAERVV